MKLAVSNIAWQPSEIAAHLALLKRIGCDGVELAPNAIWPEPVDASPAERAGLKRAIANEGLELVGFHALFYTRPDLQLFADASSRAAWVGYLNQLSALCGELGGRVLIVGSPKNRVRHGRSESDSLAWATEAFRAAAEAAAANGVIVCIEPLPAKETEFIVSSDEGAALVERVGHPGFGLHLDAKAMFEQGEDTFAAIMRHGRAAAHFHAGDPGLAPPGSTGFDHAPVGRALRASGYDGYVSIEMRRGFGPTMDVITESVNYTRRAYWGLPS